MFDLDRAITDWRRRMAQGGVEQDSILDELECHLRDELEAQIRFGLPPERAFAAAVQRVGEARVLGHEFAMSITPLDRMKDIVFTLAGIPNQNLANTMNTTRAEPAWATYLKALAFLKPVMNIR